MIERMIYGASAAALLLGGCSNVGEQDELPVCSQEQLLAAAFVTNGEEQLFDQDPNAYRADELDTVKSQAATSLTDAFRSLELLAGTLPQLDNDSVNLDTGTQIALPTEDGGFLFYDTGIEGRTDPGIIRTFANTCILYTITEQQDGFSIEISQLLDKSLLGSLGDDDPYAIVDSAVISSDASARVQEVVEGPPSYTTPPSPDEYYSDNPSTIDA